MSEIPERVAKLEGAVEAHDEEIKRVREIPGELKLLILRLEGLATELSSHSGKCSILSSMYFSISSRPL